MYTIGDFLIQVKNAYMAGRKNLTYRRSNAVFAIAKLLEKEGYLGKIKDEKSGSEIVIDLKYSNKMPALSEVNLVSRPSAHRFINKSNLKKAVARHGIAIISTSKGIMTSKQAQKEGLGGEIICQIY